MLLAFSMPGEPAVVALRCLIAAAWPGGSRLQPLEKDRSTVIFWPSWMPPRGSGDKYVYYIQMNDNEAAMLN